MSVLEDLSTSAKEVADRAGAGVVRVGRHGGRGCGIVVAPGKVLTNAHNVRGQEITVAFGDGRTVGGRVAGVDVDGELAVIDVHTGAAPALEWADTPATPGDAVFAVARGSDGGVRVTLGLVSATGRSFRGPRGRRVTGSVEHSAPLPRGSSGGPVVDGRGRLVGINTARLGEGFYLAIPADAELRARIDALAAGQSKETPRLGVGLAPAAVARKLRRAVGLPERDGLLVRVVEEGSPADRAGIRQGDLIVAVGGEPVASVDDLFAALEDAGEGVDLTVVRGTDEVDVHVSFSDTGGEEGTA